MHVSRIHKAQLASVSPLAVIVDDDEAVLETMSMLLEAAGYAVLGMSTAEQNRASVAE